MLGVFDIIKTLVTHSFTLRALIVGGLISLCAALLGVTLVLKRYSMIGDGLSHVGFGAMSVALVLNISPLFISLPITIITAFLLLKLNEKSTIKGDAATAIVSSSAMAFGVAVTAMNSGMNVDVWSYMFGTILGVDRTDLLITIVVAFVVLFCYILFYNIIFSVTFDENFAKVMGIKTGTCNMLIALLSALVVVVGMRMMGALMISSLIIFPAITSMRIFGSFKKVVICSSLLSIFCFFVGVVASYNPRIPIGASVVLVNLIVFILFSVCSRAIKGKKIV